MIGTFMRPHIAPTVISLVALALVVACSSGSRSTPPIVPPSGNGTPVDVTTYRNDLGRTGQNLSETLLTPANVNSANFGLVGVLAVDGKVDAEPLYISKLLIGGQNHNVVFVETEHASVYAFDADSLAQLWKVSVLGAGETPSDDHACPQITPEIGITSTPVIDRKRSPGGAIYVVAMSKDGTGNYHQRLHALDLSTGAELAGSPREVQAVYPGSGAGSSGGNVVFDPAQYAERAALLLLNGTIYTGWTSHCDAGTYTGWMIAYDASTLNQSAVLNLTPNGSEGSIWMSGGGLAADASGNVYAITANGTFDTTLDGNGLPVNHDFGNAFVKVSTIGGLAVTDYFTPFNTVEQSNADADLGSGGVLLLPDLQDDSGHTLHLAVGGGKPGDLFVINRDAMGKFNSANNAVYQELPSAVSGLIFSTPAYFNHTVYVGAVGDRIRSLPVVNAKLAPQTTATTHQFIYPGVTPSISANGSTNGILWAAENQNTAVLHAYDAADLSHELYNSQQAGSRDSYGPGNKFITPMISGGRVFVGSANGVGVFGLLH